MFLTSSPGQGCFQNTIQTEYAFLDQRRTRITKVQAHARRPSLFASDTEGVSGNESDTLCVYRPPEKRIDIDGAGQFNPREKAAGGFFQRASSGKYSSRALKMVSRRRTYCWRSMAEGVATKIK